MNRSLVALVVALALIGCTHKSDDSAALSKAKTDTNTAIDATKGAVLNGAEAAKEEARVLADKTKAAAAEARTSPTVKKAQSEADAAVDATKEKAAEVAGKTQALVDQAKDKISN